MHGRNFRRPNQSPQHPSTRAELDEGRRIQKYTSRGTSKRNVGKVGAIAGRVQRVGNRVFTGRMTSGPTVGSKYKCTESCTHAPHIVIHYNATNISRPPSVTNPRKTLTAKFFTVMTWLMTWLSRRVAWPAGHWRAKRPLRTLQCSDRRSLSTLQPRHRYSGRS